MRASRAVTESPWKTHVGFSVEILRAPRSVNVWTLKKPAPLPSMTSRSEIDWDMNGVNVTFEPDKEWVELLDSVLGDSLKDATELGKDYAGWSRASEDWLGDVKGASGHGGRGTFPKFPCVPMLEGNEYCMEVQDQRRRACGRLWRPG